MKTHMLLPKLPSGVIRLSLVDLRIAEKHPNYTVRMDDWHLAHPYSMPHCAVCLAGAIIAHTGKAQLHTDASPADFTHKTTERKLRGLDQLRRGNVDNFLSHFPYDYSGVVRKKNPSILLHKIPCYTLNPTAFKRSLTNLARKLERINL